MIFGQDMILPIKYVSDWEYIRHNKQEQIGKYSICENSTRIDYDYRVGYQVTLSNKSVYTKKITFKGQYNFFKHVQVEQ